MSFEAVVDKLFAAHGITGPWQQLQATGVANHIYATEHVVLRVATDHPEALCDARTESVAAPTAHAAGILTPGLIAFDDSRTIVDRPFSLWERVHGETFGTSNLNHTLRNQVWHQIGQELARLHQRVTSCPDPNGYLDSPGREPTLDDILQQLADTGYKGSADIERLIADLSPFVSQPAPATCFVHHDLHAWNIMCTKQGKLLALIDWGDAGWGDPTLDFGAIPMESIQRALEGYNDKNKLGPNAEARIVWDHLHSAINDAIDDPQSIVPVAELRRFLDGAR